MPAFRDGQRALSVAVWRSAQRGQVLMAQAPTGIGKTLGVLFPLLKALPARGAAPGLDKLYVLTAKTPGRAIALDAMRRLQPPSGGAEPALRVLELVARETACEYPGRACHGEDCPLARGFWDRLPAARAAAVAEPGGVLDAATLRRVGLAHTVCPYHLAQELLPWVDAVVGAYNHWFDSGGMLYARTTEEGWRVAVAVDEAHNLVERARSMYSASLDALELRAARRTIARPLAAPLRRLERVLARVPEPAPERVPERSAGGAAPPAAYRAFDALPDGLSEALHAALAALTQAMLEAPSAQPEPAALALPLEVPADAPERVDAAQRLRELGYTLGAWLRLAERFGAHSMFEVDASRSGAGVGAPGVRYGLRNLVPGPHVASRWSAAVTTVLFSATLRPEAWHTDLLGLPAARLAQVDVPAPFAAAQLRVQVAQQLSTRWRDRARSLPALVDLMAAQWRAEPGNYLAFFSSHDYLQQAHAAFTAAHPDVPVWAQSRAMPEPERAAFLARFVPAGRGIGFAVLGGAFGEGIDLVGDRLIGAFIATLGLPSVSPVLEAMRERLDAQFPGRGDDYVGLYPGLQRVVQAAGRVIRGPEDRGILVFMDDRYASARVRALLPSWWPQPTLLRR